MKHLLLTLIVFVAVVGCNDSGTQSPGDTFDRKAMLTSMADSMIVPGYSTLSARVQSFENACENFVQDPTIGSLTNARFAWSYMLFSWEDMQQFDFGPAESSTGNLSVAIGTFPTNAQKTEAYIAASDTSFVNYDRDTRGIYAAEYLLFGPNGDSAEVVAAFVSSPARKAYLRSVVRDIKNRIAPVVTAWKGAYREAFIANNGTAVGSSTSLVFNEFNKSYENIKNYKWALPLGLQVGQSGPEPTKVECYYSSKTSTFEGKSLSATRAHFAAAVKTWEYFKPYLAVVAGGAVLITQTEQQIAATKAALDAVPSTPSLAVQVATSPAAATAAYTELQKLTRFFKSEMSSRLGIAITYSSGDGD
jgi:predicted lipoprotein